MPLNENKRMKIRFTVSTVTHQLLRNYYCCVVTAGSIASVFSNFCNAILLSAFQVNYVLVQ